MKQSLKVLGSILLLGILAPGVPIGLSLPAQSLDTEVDPGVKKVEEVLKDLQENEQSEEPQSKTYTLAESDLNAYLEAQLKKDEHKGVDALAVRLNHDNNRWRCSLGGRRRWSPPGCSSPFPAKGGCCSTTW